ncbi:YqhG family protein [Longirhabdus pacifica]|uniref:YqhG family protein n=1 Tax=Longirhabdus pacifica TaxID=2305227 RepID=UPI0013E8CDDC|nr:YqhG family protein [Longirhabdus pacifica]
MKQETIKNIVEKYLNENNSHIIEKGSHHFTAKLSPQADKDLTNREYYWGFVERCNVEPETMTFTFIFDEQQYNEQKNMASLEQPQQQNQPMPQGRFAPIREKRAIEAPLHPGAEKLQKIFSTIKGNGKFVTMFEVPQQHVPYKETYCNTWLNVNFKIESICDLKKEMIYSLGICLSTGEIKEQFFSLLKDKDLSPKIPSNVLLKDTISLSRAAKELEHYLWNKVKVMDHEWSMEAHHRLTAELQRLETYYEILIGQAVDPEVKENMERQYEDRKAEMMWQYEPRIVVNTINCGLFHLL